MAEPRRDGPSAIARHDLSGDVPAGYWQRWSEGAAERIRAQVQRNRAKLEEQLGPDAYALDTDDLPPQNPPGLSPLGCFEHYGRPRADCRYCESRRPR
jgi:hypothetical protein